jgi:hypothetical protein
MNLRLTSHERSVGVWWVAATAVGWAVGFYVCEAVKAFVSTLNSDGLIIGGSIGIAQWLVLRHRLAPMRWWVVLSILGFGIGKAAGQAVSQGLPAALGLVLTGAVIGLSVGIVQWLALQGPLSRAGWWLAASVAGWAVGWIIIGVVEDSVGVAIQWVYLGGATGAAVAGIITGFALILMRRPGPDARSPAPAP